MALYVSDFMVAKISINSVKKGGWTESYKINTLDYASGKTTLTTLCNYRSAILAAGFQISDATLSKSLILRDSAVPNGYSYLPTLLAAETEIESCNNPGVGLLYRFDTGVGKSSNHLFRGVRDGWVEDNTSQYGTAFLNAFGGVGGRPAFGTAMTTALDAWIKTLAANTVFIIDRNKIGLDPLPDPSERFEVLAYTRVQFRKVAQRDTGAGKSTGRGRRRARV